MKIDLRYSLIGILKELEKFDSIIQDLRTFADTTGLPADQRRKTLDMLQRVEHVKRKMLDMVDALNNEQS